MASRRPPSGTRSDPRGAHANQRHGSGASRDRPLRSPSRGAIDLERLVVWTIVVAAILAIVGTYVTVGAEWRKDTPEVKFEFGFDNDTKTLTVRHAGGDPIEDTGTKRLAVVIDDVSANANATAVWVADNPARVTDRGDGYPVREGATFTVDDPTVDSDGDENFHDGDGTVGIQFAPDDRVRVVWTGSLHDAQIESVTIAETTVANATAA